VVLTRGQKFRGYVSRHRYWLALIGVLAAWLVIRWGLAKVPTGEVRNVKSR